MITHNAMMPRMANRVLHFADGRLASEEVNEHRLAPAEIDW